MKASIVAVVIALFAVSIIRADETETEYARILKERDATLSELVRIQETKYDHSYVDWDTVAAARLALWTFRRDTAKTPAEKIKQQELIVGVYEKRLEFVKSKQGMGIAAQEEFLTATDAFLQAKQTLEELKQSANAQTQAPNANLNLTLPQTAPEAAPAGKNQIGTPGATIVIQKDGAILFNGKKVTEEQLSALLHQVQQTSRDIPVLVSMDENTPAKTLAFVMDACRKEGLNKISMQTR